MEKAEQPNAGVVRLSFRGMILILLVLLVVGFAGGTLASYWFQPSLPPLTDNPNQLVATVQEVTISPGKAASDVVAEQSRSVLLIARKSGSGLVPVSMGAVVTNDGIVVVPGLLPAGQGDLLAYDGSNAGVGLDFIGQDSVYGLSYYRLQEGVLTPFDLTKEDPAVGSLLIRLGRNSETAQPMAEMVSARDYRLGDSGSAPGWQRLVDFSLANDNTSDFLNGTVLLAEDGSMAGLQIETSATAVPMSVLRESLQRLATQKRELDALSEWGIGLRYDFVYSVTTEQPEFVAEVATVTSGSAAAKAQLRAGDRLLTVGGQDIDWDVLTPTLFSSDESSLEVKRERNGRAQEVVLTKDLNRTQ